MENENEKKEMKIILKPTLVKKAIDPKGLTIQLRSKIIVSIVKRGHKGRQEKK